jgi:hypothetical protein
MYMQVKFIAWGLICKKKIAVNYEKESGSKGNKSMDV